MKKTIIIIIILMCAFAVSSYGAYKLLTLAYSVHNVHTTDELWLEIYDQLFNEVYLPYGILALVAAIATLAAMIIIAIKDFPVFKPLVDKFNAKRAAHKQASDAAKAEKAEADKKARIEKLTAELEELKKDE